MNFGTPKSLIHLQNADVSFCLFRLKYFIVLQVYKTALFSNFHLSSIFANFRFLYIPALKWVLNLFFKPIVYLCV